MMGASICSSESPWTHVSAALGHLQVSAVALGPDGNLYSLDRAGRRWEQSGAPDILSSHVIRCWNSCGQEVAAFGADLSCLFGVELGDEGLGSYTQMTVVCD
jgi:hypothetical protein